MVAQDSKRLSSLQIYLRRNEEHFNKKRSGARVLTIAEVVQHIQKVVSQLRSPRIRRFKVEGNLIKTIKCADDVVLMPKAEKEL